MPLSHIKPPEAELVATTKPQLARWKWISTALFIVIAVGSTGYSVWYLPVYEIGHVKTTDARSRQELINESRKTLAQIMGGMILLTTGLLGAYFTLRQLATTQSGQITDRFSKAVDHLASATLPTKLGGLYALERVARDSPSDHWTVMQLLTSYVRSVAKARTSKDVPEELQVALNIIGRRVWLKVEPAGLDLRGADLSYTDLHGLNFARCDFSYARLSYGSFSGAIFENADLTHADLSSAQLDWANLRGAILTLADVSSTFFWHADLRETLFLPGACDHVNLRFADLTDAKLYNIILKECTLEGAILIRTDLSNTNLRGANLTNALLVDTDLSGTNLSGANLTNTTARYVSFATTKGMSVDQISSMHCGAEVKFPTIADM